MVPCHSFVSVYIKDDDLPIIIFFLDTVIIKIGIRAIHHKQALQ